MLWVFINRSTVHELDLLYCVLLILSDHLNTVNQLIFAAINFQVCLHGHFFSDLFSQTVKLDYAGTLYS